MTAATAELPSDAVRCPLCATPCSDRAVVCDVCMQPLDGPPPDVEGLRDEGQVHRARALAGGLCTLALLVLVVLLFRGRGFVFLFFPGGAWLRSWMRWREAAGRLKRIEAAQRPTTF